MSDPLGPTYQATTQQPYTMETSDAIVQQFTLFIEQFKDPNHGFVYKNKLQSPQQPIVLQVNLFDLPARLQQLFSSQPYRVRELFCKAAEEYAEKPVQMQFLYKQKHDALSVGQLGAQHIDKLVTIQGLLIGASKTRPKTSKLVAICRACQHRLVFQFPFGVSQMQLPQACQKVRGESDQKCPSSPYAIAPQQCQYVDCQVIKLQDDQRNTLPVFLEGCLADQNLIAGFQLQVTGVMSKFSLIGFGFQQVQKTFLQVNSVQYSIFKQFAASNPLQQLKKLIAPHLHGLDDIKLAIACQQVSGQSKLTAERTRLRGEINILLLADPGVGKSEILKTAMQLSKIAVQTSGKSTSAVGLTAAVIRDTLTGEFILEGGALVLADGGVLCIDEFDKCRADDVVALHEAMEQGTVSVNKAGVQSVLSTRVSVLAAANPAFGRYDELMGLSEQMDLQATIASRFDLIFFLKDSVDSERDAMVVNKIGQNLQSLEQNNQIQQFDIQFLKQYFQEAKKIQTTLSKDAGLFLQDCWIRMRRQESNLTVTVRQLEALIRISESIAKLHLRNIILVKDAEDAFALYKASTGDASAAGMGETLGRVSALQVADAQRLIKERLIVKIPQNEIKIVQSLKQIGLAEGAVIKAIQLLIGNGDIQQLRGRMIMRIK